MEIYEKLSTLAIIAKSARESNLQICATVSYRTRMNLPLLSNAKAPVRLAEMTARHGCLGDVLAEDSQRAVPGSNWLGEVAKDLAGV